MISFTSSPGIYYAFFKTESIKPHKKMPNSYVIKRRKRTYVQLYLSFSL